MRGHAFGRRRDVPAGKLQSSGRQTVSDWGHMLLRMAGSRVNTQFGPYRLDELLGRGGMGEVYRAYDTTKDRVVALKLLNPGLAHDPMYQERFRRESHAAARLGSPTSSRFTTGVRSTGCCSSTCAWSRARICARF